MPSTSTLHSQARLLRAAGKVPQWQAQINKCGIFRQIREEGAGRTCRREHFDLLFAVCLYNRLLPSARAVNVTSIGACRRSAATQTLGCVGLPSTGTAVKSRWKACGSQNRPDIRDRRGKNLRFLYLLRLVSRWRRPGQHFHQGFPSAACLRDLSCADT